MIPVKSSSTQDRNALTAMQYSGTVVANVIVIFWFATQLQDKKARDSNYSSFGIRNYHVFQRAGLICLGLGVVFSMVFHKTFKLDEMHPRIQK